MKRKNRDKSFKLKIINFIIPAMINRGEAAWMDLWGSPKTNTQN